MSSALVSASLSLLVATGIHVNTLWSFVSRFQVSIDTIYYMPYVLLHLELCMLNYYNIYNGLKMIRVHVQFDTDICSWMQSLQLQLEVDTQKYRNFLPPLGCGMAWLGMCSARKCHCVGIMLHLLFSHPEYSNLLTLLQTQEMSKDP